MYVRIFLAHEIERWKVDSLVKLPILALEPWNCNGNSDYSVFKIKSNYKDTDSKWIVLRALADNFTKRCGGVDLFILSEKFIKNFVVEEDMSDYIGCLHANIKDIKYEQFLSIVEYTYNNQNDIISYSIDDIKSLISNLTDDEFSSLNKYYLCRHPNEKEDKFKKYIKNVYFKDGLNIPAFLKV